MQTVRLKVKTVRFTTGLLAEGMRDWLDPAISGDLVAHDALEHCNGYKAIGSVHDELQALGAVAFVRAGTYPASTLGREVGRQIAHTLARQFGSSGFSKLAAWRPVADAEREPECTNDAELREIAALAATVYNSGYRETMLARGDDILHYLRLGWRKARERFGTPKLPPARNSTPYRTL